MMLFLFKEKKRKEKWGGLFYVNICFSTNIIKAGQFGCPAFYHTYLNVLFLTGDHDDMLGQIVKLDKIIASFYFYIITTVKFSELSLFLVP